MYEDLKPHKPRGMLFPLKLRCQYHDHGYPGGVILYIWDLQPMTIKRIERAYPLSCECWGEIRDSRGHFVSVDVYNLLTL